VWAEWAIDAGLSDGELLCYVPVEREGDNLNFVFGMNVLADPDHPPGNVIMAIHPGGDKAAEKWASENSALLERVKAANQRIAEAAKRG